MGSVLLEVADYDPEDHGLKAVNTPTLKLAVENAEPELVVVERGVWTRPISKALALN